MGEVVVVTVNEKDLILTGEEEVNKRVRHDKAMIRNVLSPRTDLTECLCPHGQHHRNEHTLSHSQLYILWVFVYGE